MIEKMAHYAKVLLMRRPALIVVDMQRDYIDPQGWFALTSGNTAPFTAILPVVARVLAAVRRAGIFVVFAPLAVRLYMNKGR